MRVRTIRALFLAALLLQPCVAPAAPFPRRLAHYTHQRWSAESEVPGSFFVMAQGRDGYLWLTAGDGLFRFDGIRFEAIEITPKTAFQGSPTALLVARNGDVWTNFSKDGQFGVYRNGALRLVPSPPYRQSELIMSMAQTPDGAIWTRVGDKDRGPLRYWKGKWRRFGSRDGLPVVDEPSAMIVGQDGTLWLSYPKEVMRLVPGASRFVLAARMPDSDGVIAEDPAGRIWVSGASGSYPVTGPGGRGTAPKVRFPYRTGKPGVFGRPMFDRAGNLWIALQFGGVQRVARPDPGGAASAAEAASAVESITKREGLTSDMVTQVFEDRESNIWILTESGLDKYRPATVRVEPGLNDPSYRGDILTSVSDGTVYIGEAHAVHRVAPGRAPEPILTGMSAAEAICEAPDGAMWMAFEDRVLVWKNGAVRTLPKKPATNTGFGSCAFDRRGDFWATAASSGLFRFRQGRWESMFGPPDPARLHPTMMVRDAGGALFLGWNAQALGWLDYPVRSSLPIRGKPADRTVRGMYARPRGGVVAAGGFGFSRYRDGTVRTIGPGQSPQLEAVDGIVETPDGYTWTTSQEQVARTRTRDIDRAFADPRFTPSSLTLGTDDGLPGRVYADSPSSIVRGGDGRLWLGTLAGSAWIDPQDILRNMLAPPVAIVSAKVGEAVFRDPRSLRLPPAPKSIEIDYTGLSFANPKKVAFRYKLEGYDADWIDPGRRRQAFYTNLAPGTYRFRVIAANSEGVWNRTGATLDIEIPPTFLQSRWFLALCVALGLGLLWLLYRLRVAQVARGIRTRLEERLSERERIARELHDTLLQSVQGLVLRFQSVANRMPPEERARTQLEAALKRADDIIVDGRNRVRDLRPSARPGDLPDLLQALAEGAGFDPPIPIRIVVEGKPRPIDPLVSDEIRRIASEALFNIARHARATAVDVTISFTAQLLTIQIRDDGIGIPEAIVAEGGKTGHFGLVGMRERAERIGGSLAIVSQAGQGCEVTVTLPARVAFTDRDEGRWRVPFLARLWKGSADV